LGPLILTNNKNSPFPHGLLAGWAGVQWIGGECACFQKMQFHVQTHAMQFSAAIQRKAALASWLWLWLSLEWSGR